MSVQSSPYDCRHLSRDGLGNSINRHTAIDTDASFEVLQNSSEHADA